MYTCRALIISLVLYAIFIASCTHRSTYEAQGYIEGRYTYMATNVSGVLKQLLVERGTRAYQNQLLFILEAQPESDAYTAAVGNLKQATDARDAIAANLNFAKITYERYKVLVLQHAIPQSLLDNAQSNYFSTLAQLAQANANIATSTATLAQAQWVLQQKSIYSPVDAIVFDTYFRLGEYVEANQAILSLLAPEDIKAIFYVPEAELGRIKLNNKVTVRCDGCAQTYMARISFISPTAEYTPPVIFSNDTNTKLIYRVEADFITPQDAYHLHPGQPITVNYFLHE